MAAAANREWAGAWVAVTAAEGSVAGFTVRAFQNQLRYAIHASVFRFALQDVGHRTLANLMNRLTTPIAPTPWARWPAAALQFRDRLTVRSCPSLSHLRFEAWQPPRFVESEDRLNARPRYDAGVCGPAAARAEPRDRWKAVTPPSSAAAREWLRKSWETFQSGAEIGERPQPAAA